MKSQIYDGLYSAEEIRVEDIDLLERAADAVISDKVKAAENMGPKDKAETKKLILAIGSVVDRFVDSEPRLTDVDRLAIEYGYEVEPTRYLVIPIDQAVSLQEVLDDYSDMTTGGLAPGPGSSRERAVDGYIAGEMADQLTDLLDQPQPEA
jgi:hypothetical protein